MRALQSADVILFDDLVSREVLDFARREARKMLVGKTGYGPSCKQDEINALMVSLAKQGKRVVRLKGGDPLIFGRAGEEIEACRPPIFRSRWCPASPRRRARRAGSPSRSPIAARRGGCNTSPATPADGALPDDIDWRSLADPTVTTAVYMPAKTLAALVERALSEGLDAATPAVAISRATRHDQQSIAAPISELPARLRQANLPGPLLVMIGRVIGDAAQAAAPARQHG